MAAAAWAAQVAAASAAWSVESRPLPGLESAAVELPSGESYDLARALGRRFTVLAFVRGAWCPFSVQLLKELRNHEPALLGKGFQIIAITPDRPFRVRQMLDELDLPFVVVADRTNAAARAFGLAPVLSVDQAARYAVAASLPEVLPGDPRPRLPRPSVLVIGEDGRSHAVVAGLVEEVRFTAEDLFRACDEARRRGRGGGG